MTILKTIIRIDAKLSDNRFVNQMSAEEVLCFLKAEIAELSAETNLTDLEALMLAGVAMATISNDQLFRNYQNDLHKIGSRINISNYEILRHFKTLDALAEKDLITISDFDFEILPEKVAGKRMLTQAERIKSAIPQFNKRYELSERFVMLMLGD